MSDVMYMAEAHVTGGRAEGHGRTSDGVLQVDLSVSGRAVDAAAVEPLTA